MKTIKAFALIGTIVALTLPARAYVSPDGYQITPPPGWKADLSDADTHHVYFDSPSTAEVGISMSRITPGETTGSDAGLLIGFLEKQGRDFRVVSQRSGMLAGTPDREFVVDYTPLGHDLPLRVRQVLLAHGGTMYAISITETQRNYAHVAPLFDRSLRSLRWTR